jgi:hypothetical protein
VMIDIAIPFRTVIDVTKAVEEDGKKYLLGESSGPEVDTEEQFMTKSCVADMAAQINAKPIPYLDEHSKKGVASHLGEVVKASVTPEYHLSTRTELDPDNPTSMMLWTKVRQGKQFGQSVAGYALRLAKRTLADRVLKGFDRVRLDHIANTTRPSWQHGLGAMIAKSQDWSEVEWSEVDEYEGDLFLPEVGPVVEKRSEPDKKAGKKAVVVDTLKKLLSLLASFDWASYKEYAATVNRDDIILGPPPVTDDVSPVGPPKPTADTYQKSYDEVDESWLEYIEKAKPEENNLPSLADTYERLVAVSKALPEGDDLSPTVAMAVFRILDVLAPPGPQVKAYNEEVITKSADEIGDLEEFLEEGAVHGLDSYLGVMEASGRQVLKSFGETDVKGTVDPGSHQRVQSPTPVGAGGVLTDFDQIAEVGHPPPTLQQYKEEILKSDAPLREKQAALKRVGETVLAGMMEELSQSAPEEDRVALTVEKTVVPLLERLIDRIDSLERQVAITKSEAGGEPPGRALVRKSLDPGIRPSRSISNQKATFRGLVKGDQYMEVDNE